MSLEIIVPRKITYISSNAVVDNEATYDPLITSVVGDIVIFENNIYSATSPSLGKQPDENVEWFREQSTNPYALLDGRNTAKTHTVGTYIGEFTFEKCDTLALIDATGKVLTIEELNENNIVIDTHIHIITEIVDATSWYNFFLQGIPDSATGNFEQTLTFNHIQKVRITITGNNPSIGFLVAGRVEDMGCTKWGISPSFINPTPAVKNGFGNVNLVKGNYQTKLDMDVWFDTKDIDNIYFRFAELQDTAIYVVADSRYRALKTFGYIAHFVPILESNNSSSFSLSIESFVKGEN